MCTQPINSSKAAYEKLSRLELADLGYATSHLEIDLLIGSEKVVTGRVLKGDGGPTAIKNKLGWMGLLRAS